MDDSFSSVSHLFAINLFAIMYDKSRHKRDHENGKMGGKW